MTGQSLFTWAKRICKKQNPVDRRRGRRRAGKLRRLKLLQSEGQLTIASTGKESRQRTNERRKLHVEGRRDDLL